MICKTSIAWAVMYIVMILLLGLVSCSSTPPNSTAVDGKESTPFEVLAIALPPLPVTREVASPVSLAVEGSDVYDSIGASVVDSDLQLSAPGGAIAWGIWELVPGDDTLSGVEIAASVGAGNSFYIALADYANNRWVIDGPLSGGKQYDLQDEIHRSAVGRCYVAVLTFDQDSALVDKLILHTDRQGWQIVTIEALDSEDWVIGEGLDLAVVNSKPAIAYSQWDTVLGGGKISYGYCASLTGEDAADWTSSVVKAATIGRGAALTEIEGRPAIAFGGQELHYVRSSSTTGSSDSDWTGLTTVDEGYSQDVSLAVVDGHPAISYIDGSGNLKYCWSETSRGDHPTAWRLNVMVDDEGAIHTGTSLTVVKGNPAIAAYDRTNEGIIYARAGNSTGNGAASWLNRVATVDVLPTQQYRAYCSLAYVDGYPAICYYNNAGGNLNFLRSDSTWGQGSSWPADPVVIDTVGEWGKSCSLAMIAAKPAIICYDSSGYVTYIASTSSSGLSAGDWSFVSQVDYVGDAGSDSRLPHTDLAEVDGKAAIAYYDADDNALKYAVLYQ